MAKRYFIQLSYKGTNFHGWQKQKNAITIQEILERALSIIFHSTIKVIGAGRTDTGVHARYFVAHFDVDETNLNTNDFIFHINQILPFEIAVKNIIPVKPTAHARFDAISRTYEYQAMFEKNPFQNEFCYKLYKEPDLSALSESCKVLLQYSDFTSFCKLHSNNLTNVCKIMEAYWRFENNMYIFRIKADRFLRDMVRAITGSMLDVGFGKISLSDFQKIIEAKNRNAAGMSLPACGLYLVDIEYPLNIFCL